MPNVSIAQPDITLHLDMDGVIRKASLSNGVSEESMEAWLGRPWGETVANGGSRSVQRMVDDARQRGVSGFRQVSQRFPSGHELPMEYMTVRLGGDFGLLAVGRNLHAVAELQSRLVAAQQAMERDYWKLREVETRYRLLFDAANDAVLLVRATDLQVIEANPAAIRALGIAPVGQDLLDELAPKERGPFRDMLQRVQEHGKAPSMLVHLGRDRQAWLVRASQMASQPGAVYLLQLTPAGTASTAPEPSPTIPVGELIERIPDGFVVIDVDGVIVHANSSFLDLIQVPVAGLVLGERLRRWLGRPGADLTVVLAGVQRRGVVRLFATLLHGDLGSELEVELSAVGNVDGKPQFIGILVRDVGHRLPNGESAAPDGLGRSLTVLNRQLGKTPLLDLVKSTVEIVERQYIAAALELTRGNRTAAAELLGLSRQSLYVKLSRYGLDGNSDAGD